MMIVNGLVSLKKLILFQRHSVAIYRELEGWRQEDARHGHTPPIDAAKNVVLCC